MRKTPDIQKGCAGQKRAGGPPLNVWMVSQKEGLGGARHVKVPGAQPGHCESPKSEWGAESGHLKSNQASTSYWLCVLGWVTLPESRLSEQKNGANNRLHSQGCCRLE